VAAPTKVPPDVQVVGAEEDGPKTVKEMGLTSFVPEDPLNVAVMEAAGMAVPTLAALGAATLKVGDANETTVSDIADPQTDAAVLLVPSPP
jgi:hypothetical protein